MYILGELSGLNVVLPCLPGTQGKGAAATFTTTITRTSPFSEWWIFVGIGVGVPGDKHDIHLGDMEFGSLYCVERLPFDIVIPEFGEVSGIEDGCRHTVFLIRRRFKSPT